MSFRHIATLAVLLAVVIAAEGRPYDALPEGPAKAKFELGPAPDGLKTFDKTSYETNKTKQVYLKKAEAIKLPKGMDVAIEKKGKDGNRNLMASYDIAASRLDASEAEFERSPGLDDLKTLYKTITELIGKGERAYLETEAIKLLEKMRVERKMWETDIEVPFPNRHEIDLRDKTAQGNSLVFPNHWNEKLKESYDIDADWLDASKVSGSLVSGGAPFTYDFKAKADYEAVNVALGNAIASALYKELEHTIAADKLSKDILARQNELDAVHPQLQALDQLPSREAVNTNPTDRPVMLHCVNKISFYPILPDRTRCAAVVLKEPYYMNNCQPDEVIRGLCKNADFILIVITIGTGYIKYI
uniref:Uncharacterized protein n=1 Tax=Branchiostoma floridae TaxID=7739 RepID=C3Y6M4_BRAFL|eukprot:XP_002607974.1 hypothetical protein BRAFLDRAFT_120855 [Branchiostoma floridae]